MMDPVSISSAAAGLLSLGMQVVGGISGYVGAIQQRRDELDAAHRHVQILRRLIVTIESVSHTQEANHREATAVVRGCLTEAESQLKDLGNFIADLDDKNASQSSLAGPSGSTITYIIKKMKLMKKTAGYPLHLDKVQNLERRLEAAIGALQSALLILNM